MANLSKFCKYRDLFDQSQLIEEDIFPHISTTLSDRPQIVNLDDLESVTKADYRFLSSPSADIFTLSSETDSD
jgi:hypothetical protein